MRPHTLTKMMFDCRCGTAHPQVTRLAGVPVLVCPEALDDSLRLHIDPTGNVRIVMGGEDRDGKLLVHACAQTDMLHDQLLKIQNDLTAALTRLDALEAKLKGRGKE